MLYRFYILFIVTIKVSIFYIIIPSVLAYIIAALMYGIYKWFKENNKKVNVYGIKEMDDIIIYSCDEKKFLCEDLNCIKSNIYDGLKLMIKENDNIIYLFEDCEKKKSDEIDLAVLSNIKFSKLKKKVYKFFKLKNLNYAFEQMEEEIYDLNIFVGLLLIIKKILIVIFYPFFRVYSYNNSGVSIIITNENIRFELIGCTEEEKLNFNNEVKIFKYDFYHENIILFLENPKPKNLDIQYFKLKTLKKKLNIVLKIECFNFLYKKYNNLNLGIKFKIGLKVNYFIYLKKIEKYQDIEKKVK